MRKIELTITLNKIEPLVLRKIRVPFDITFLKLHEIIQTIFPWRNLHMYKFVIKEPSKEIICDKEVLNQYDKYISGKDEDKFEGFVKLDKIYPVELQSVYTTKLEDVLNPQSKINYIYDFGDNWNHTIHIDKIIEYKKENDSLQIEVLEVKGICPPEDAGGITGFYQIKESLFNEDSKNHDDLKKWADNQKFIDKEPDIDKLNDVLNRKD